MFRLLGRKKCGLSLILAAVVLISSVAAAGISAFGLDTMPSIQTPMGIIAYMDELFGGKPRGWTDGGSNDPNQNTLLGDYPWRVQYYDSNPEWDGFYSFKFMRGNSWSDKIDEYVIGQDWLNSTGQVSFQGGIPYFITDASEGISIMCFTFIVPRDGVYKIAPSSVMPNIRVMYPEYFPGGSNYNDGMYVPPSSTLKLGFAIHKMSEDADMDTYNPSGSTKIYPTDADYLYITKDSISLEFPTLNRLELKAGERIRFILDCTGTEGIEDWLVSACMLPTIKLAENTPPTAENASYECTIGKTVSGVLPGSDPDEGAALTYTLKTNPTKGSVVINPDGTFVYTANIGVDGSDSFVYTVTDEEGASSDGTITINFVANKSPVAGKTSFSTIEDTELQGNLMITDEDGDAFTATLKSTTSHGQLELNANGTFVYTPDSGYVGEDSFVVTISDEKTPVDVTITINIAKNVPPVGEAMKVKTLKDNPVEFALSATDENGTPLTFEISEQPKHGTVSINGDKATYTPNSGFIGLDRFTYKASDGVNYSDSIPVDLIVLGKGYDSVKTLKDAVVECGEGADLNKRFDFTEYSYDLPWQVHYRIDGITGDIEDGTSKFENAISAMITDWGGYIIGDGNTYPSNAIQNANFLGNKLIHVLNSGYLADDKNSVAALAFVAPKDATYYITAGEITDKIGIWYGQATNNPIKVWAEVDGVMVWPKDGKPLELSLSLDKVVLPDMIVAMKKGSALRFCTQGTTLNGDHNNIYLDRAAYVIGEYDSDYDPVPPNTDEPNEPNEPNNPEQPGGEPTKPRDSESPETGSALPLTATVLTAISAGSAFLARRKKRK